MAFLAVDLGRQKSNLHRGSALHQKNAPKKGTGQLVYFLCAASVRHKTATQMLKPRVKMPLRASSVIMVN